MKDGKMQDFISKITDWFKPAKSIDNEINRTTDDIAFLNRKIMQSKNMFCDVIADKLILQRDKLVVKQSKLLERQRHLFNK